MMQSFTTVLVILTATLCLATAFEDYMVLIQCGADKVEADCTALVTAEILDVIEECVADATGKHIHPKRRDHGRRMLKTSTSAASRQLQKVDCKKWCSQICEMQGFCGYTCSHCGDRRLEPEFLESDAVESLNGELTEWVDGQIKAHCKQAAAKYARDSENNCLGDHSAIDIMVKTE